MNPTAARVITIPAKPELAKERAIQRQLRVAAYCRVSTDDEEQLTSYEAQQNYYTDKIMTNPKWTMAGIFADEGITGTSATKRPEFLKMIRKCRQKKIDVVLVKSISRFARNTVDCLNYIRALRELGIAVIFEKENINTLESDSEMLITMMGAFAQAESESISQNVRWGKRQAMREGKAVIQYKHLYAYERGEDGKPKIIPEQAEVVKRIFESCLAGHSMRMIKDELERDGILTVKGGTEWSIASITNILRNEKYCGDALQQKTFISDCISGKVIRNTGQLPMYLVQDHHEGIISRDTYNAVQAELARRNAAKAPSRKSAPTGRSCYTSKYALSDRLICGDCGTLYRRCVWTHHGMKRIVWRCISRIDFGTKYCKQSPTIDEAPLQGAILSAINSMMDRKEQIIYQLAGAMHFELAPAPGESMSVTDLDLAIDDRTRRFNELFSACQGVGFTEHANKFRQITEDIAMLKEKRAHLLEQQKSDSAAARRTGDAIRFLDNASAELTEWKESDIRQLVESVKIISENRICVTLKCGIKIERELIK